MDKVTLPEPEQQELREGQALYEMTQTEGFKILRTKLEDLAFHSWVDPREVEDKVKWEWRELNGFHAANAAREMLEFIQQKISRSEYLHKKKAGEISVRPMKI